MTVAGFVDTFGLATHSRWNSQRNGLERGHYDVSMACAEHGLLPVAREASSDTVVVADGFSCRTQLQQSDAGRSGVQLAQLLADGVLGP